jgi:hypothetical protein
VVVGRFQYQIGREILHRSENVSIQTLTPYGLDIDAVTRLAEGASQLFQAFFVVAGQRSPGLLKPLGIEQNTSVQCGVVITEKERYAGGGKVARQLFGPTQGGLLVVARGVYYYQHVPEVH